MSEPKRYRALHINPGIVDYTEDGQRETVLIKKEVLDKMNPSFLGKPVFNLTHKIIDAETAFNFTDEEKEKLAVGIISGVGYDEKSGYFFADAMIWDDDTIKNIDDNGFNVSCAYVPEAGPGGVYNNVPFDEEVVGGEYHHLAVVESPRYQDAKIFQNSKSGGIMKFKLNLGKKKILQNQVPEEKPEEEEMEMNADATIEVDGESIPVSELVENYKAKKNAETEEDKGTVMNMEDTIDVDGEEVSMKDLYDSYKANVNAEDPTDQPLEDVVDETMKKNSLEDPKKPNQNFKIVQNAAAQGAEAERPKVNTMRSRLARGKAKYGTPVKNEGGDK